MSTPENKPRPDDPEIVSVIARDPNLLYWAEVLRQPDLDPDEKIDIGQAAWRAVAQKYGVGSDLQAQVFTAAKARLEEQEREHG